MGQSVRVTGDETSVEGVVVGYDPFRSGFNAPVGGSVTDDAFTVTVRVVENLSEAAAVFLPFRAEDEFTPLASERLVADGDADHVRAVCSDDASASLDTMLVSLHAPLLGTDFPPLSKSPSAIATERLDTTCPVEMTAVHFLGRAVAVDGVYFNGSVLATDVTEVHEGHPTFGHDEADVPVSEADFDLADRALDKSGSRLLPDGVREEADVDASVHIQFTDQQERVDRLAVSADVSSVDDGQTLFGPAFGTLRGSGSRRDWDWHLDTS